MKLSLGGLNKYRMEYNKSKKTYWIERDKTINSMKKQF